MSDSSPAPEEKPARPAGKPARPLNRLGIGFLSAMQLALVAIILIALNYLSAHHFKRADHSRDADYSLSPASTRYLESEAISQRQAPVKWIMAFRRSSPFYERVRALSEEYARLSGGKIELEVVDPLRSPDHTQQIMAAYELSFVRDMIIIDARSDESAVLSQDPTGTRTLNPNIKLAVADEMVLHTVNHQGQRSPSGFRGEDVLTARLVEAIEGRPRQMLFLADKSRIGSEGEESPWKSLESTLRYQNIALNAVNLAGLRDIPEGTEGVALVAPKYDLSDSEIAVLERYWSRPRAALLVLLDGEAPPKLRAFLRANGVTPRRDRVITRDGGRTISTVRANFTPGIQFTKDLAGQATLFEGISASLEVREGQDDLIDRKIFPAPLVQVGEGFWGETKFGDGKETYDEREDHAGPLYLAASVVRGAATDDRYAADTSRMIIVSNTAFLDPANQRAENIDFLASSVNWLVGRESLAGIGPRSLGTYKLPVLDAQVSFINRVNLFFMPAFLFLVGGFIWSSRRA